MPNPNGPKLGGDGDPPQILIVDDDEDLRGFAAEVLGGEGLATLTAASAAEARDLIDRQSFALVLCDMRMPGESGLELLAALREADPELAVVMISGLDDPMLARVAFDRGACGYLVKPFRKNELLIAVEAGLHRRREEAHQRAHELRPGRDADDDTDANRPAASDS